MQTQPPVPPLRIRAANAAPPRGGDARYVLYWMTAQRRTTHNYALQRAGWWAEQRGLPVLVFEALRLDYPWASARHHRFILDGMAANQRACAAAGVTYRAYVEPEAGAGRGLLEALARQAAVVITDHWPAFFVPRMVRAVAARLDVRLEEVDGNGVLPLAASKRAWPTAHGFRRHLQKTLPDHFDRPAPAPLDAIRALGSAPCPDLPRWPAPTAFAGLERQLPIDQTVAPVPGVTGGPEAGQARLDAFIEARLDRYAERNQPDAATTSGLSPYLHYGHVGAHQVAGRVWDRAGWHIDRVEGVPPRGQRAGWWGLDAASEGFLDQVITWREVGFAFAEYRPGEAAFTGLPPWAQQTLLEHAADPRPFVYTLDDFAAGRTHDPLWNAAQRQLREAGTIHTYLRMLWGKKILHWSESPQAAVDILFELNNRYALDGRDPNSDSGLLWCLGRYDRAWGPERPVFGKIRYMTSDSAMHKLRLRGYLARWGDQPSLIR